MKTILFTLLLLMAIPSVAAAEAFSGQAVSPGGSPLSSATIVVCSGWSDSLISNPTTPCDSVLPKATIYGNAAMTGELGNPLYADVDGRYSFLAPNGEYTISVGKSGYNTYTYEAGSNPSSGATLQTNGVNNTSQSTLNFTNPSSFNGLNFSFSNPTGGEETFTLSGTLNNSGLANSAVTLGSTSVSLGGTISSAAGFNAATATDLASYPSLCSGGQFSQGLGDGPRFFVPINRLV